MILEKLISLASRLFFLGAFVLLGIGLIERIANAFGYSILLLETFSGSRYLEIAVILLVFVIAMQLREIKGEIKKGKP